MPARDGFFAARAAEGTRIWARIRGREYRLDVDARGETGTLHRRRR